jgi:hypothetical protein
MRLLVVLVTLLAAGVPAALGAPAARAAAFAPPAGRALSGLSGADSASAFVGAVGRRPAVFGTFVRWGTPVDRAFAAAARMGARTVLHVSTAEGQGSREVITPLGIARGGGDGWLLALNARLAREPGPVYVRLLAEMNQSANAYSGYDAAGRPREARHRPAAFRRAWRRCAVVLRGGPVAAIDARLRALRLPPVRTRAAALPRPRVALQWVPQTAGSPDVPGNGPRAYWPGGRYVDWVGTDFYSRFPGWAGLERFYRAFPRKPFVFGEWALWGRDDPAFVRRLFDWIARHPRVGMALYNQGRPGGPFRLERYPRGASALRAALRAPRWLGAGG